MGAILVFLDYDFYILCSIGTWILLRLRYSENLRSINQQTSTRSEPKCPTHGMIFWSYVQTLYSYVQKLRHAPYAPLGGLA